MSSEMTYKSSWYGVTHISGKGTLGTRWFRASHVHPGTELERMPWTLGTRMLVNHRAWGVCEPVLKLQFVWKGWYLKNVCRAEVRTGLGKSDRPGL